MRILFTFLIVIALGSGVASAQSSGLSPEQRDAILGYSLTLDRANHLIAAITPMTEYVVSQPDFAGRLAKTAKLSPAERIALMEKDPKVASILKKENLSARDYLVGVPALRMALLAAQGPTTPNIVASPANVAFAKKNLAELKPKMDKADGAGRR